MADATKKKRICGGQKAFCTSVIKEVNELVEQYSPEIEAKLKERKLVLTEKLETLNKLDDEIVERVKDEEIDGEINEAGNFRATIHEALLKLTILCKEQLRHNMQVKMEVVTEELQGRFLFKQVKRQSFLSLPSKVYRFSLRVSRFLGILHDRGS